MDIEETWDAQPVSQPNAHTFLKVVLHPQAEPLPASVWQEVGRTVTAMFNGEIYPTMEDVADCFEASVIVIGHTKEEEADARAYYSAETWPNVQGGRPVAHWRSGISTGCDQELFLMPDGSFEWTEP